MISGISLSRLKCEQAALLASGSWLSHLCLFSRVESRILDQEKPKKMINQQAKSISKYYLIGNNDRIAA